MAEPKPRPQFHITGTEQDAALIPELHRIINAYKYKHGLPTKLAALAAMLKDYPAE